MFFNELRKKRQETILEMLQDKSKLSKIVIRVNLGGTPMVRFSSLFDFSRLKDRYDCGREGYAFQGHLPPIA